MPIDPRIPQCTHLRERGDRCGSPAMRGAHKCYFHLKPPRIDDFQIPSLGDPIARMKALTEIFNALASNKIDPKRATALLFAMQVSRQNGK